MNFSIDIETLGTNVDSQILSIGCVSFDIKTGEILKKFYTVIRINRDSSIKATLGTIEFWMMQAKNNPKACEVFKEVGLTLSTALQTLATFIEVNTQGKAIMWANGVKFDISMLEYQYKRLDIKVPWFFSSDRCMRTLKGLFGKIEVNYYGVGHNALDDAIWQAKYISAAHSKCNNCQNK